MRPLSASLLAAQRSASGSPYVEVEVLDRLPDVARPVRERLYTGEEADAHHAVTVPGDGSLVRARVDSPRSVPPHSVGPSRARLTPRSAYCYDGSIRSDQRGDEWVISTTCGSLA